MKVNVYNGYYEKYVTPKKLGKGYEFDYTDELKHVVFDIEDEWHNDNNSEEAVVWDKDIMDDVIKYSSTPWIFEDEEPEENENGDISYGNMFIFSDLTSIMAESKYMSRKRNIDEARENVENHIYPIEYIDIFNLLTGRGYHDIGAKSWIKGNNKKIEMFLNKGYSAEDIVYELDGDLAGDIDESYEDTFREPNTVQQGTDDWSDFKDNFRAKTLLLKKALTPKFVSELIKRTDFEVDDKEIKAYAISIIEKANLDAKDPVQALQKRIKAHFEK